MKTTIQYEFDEDEQSTYRIYAHAIDMYYAITEAQDLIRTQQKHCDDWTPEHMDRLLERIRSALYINCLE